MTIARLDTKNAHMHAYTYPHTAETCPYAGAHMQTKLGYINYNKLNNNNLKSICILPKTSNHDNSF